MTGVLVVEDQQVLASALEIAIGTQPDMDCVGTAATVEDALSRVADRRPDVVLMDIQLPGADGIEGTRRIKAAYPDVSILILTAGATPRRLAAAAAAGARGFLAKDGPFTDILAAIRNPMPGKMVIEGATLHELIKDMPGPPQPISGQAQPAQQRAVSEAEVSAADTARLTARDPDGRGARPERHRGTAGAQRLHGPWSRQERDDEARCPHPARGRRARDEVRIAAETGIAILP